MKNLVLILVFFLINNKLFSQPLKANFNNIDTNIKIIEVPQNSNPSEIIQKAEIDTSIIQIIELNKDDIGKSIIFSYLTDSSIDLTNEMKKHLISVSLYLKKNPNSIVIIDAHSFTTDQINDEIKSNERASRALKFLISKSIEKNRIFAKGNGNRKPIADNKSLNGRIKNNRLEIIVKQR